MKTEIDSLKGERYKLIQEMRAITLTAESEERDLTAEEAQEFDRIEKEAESLEKRASRLETLAGYGTSAREIKPAEGIVDDPEEKRYAKNWGEFQEIELRSATTEARVNFARDEPEYRHAFWKLMQRGMNYEILEPEEQRVLSKASAGAGANLVPTEFENRLIDLLRFTGVMREVSTVITTDSGATLQIPTISAHGTATWTAENAAFTASDETFGQNSLSAYKSATIMLVSEELLQDSAFDLEAFISDQFSQRIGVLQNTAFVVGDGSGKPTGVATQASAGVTAAGASTVTGDDLIGLYYSLLVPYRRNAVFIVADSSMSILRKLKDSQGRYLFEPSLTAGTPDTFMAKPIYADPDMAAATTGNISALFGDFSYYWIRQVAGVGFQRLNELYAANGQVGFRAFQRVDGKLMNTSAVKKLTQP